MLAPPQSNNVQPILEITPAVMERITNLLAQTHASEQQARLSAEAQIREMSLMIGFKSALVRISLTPTIPPQLRLLAIILFKNSIDATFRMRLGVNVENLEIEKTQIREQLLSTQAMNEGDTKVAKQLSVCVAEIAKHDWPRHWDTLFPTLLQAMQQTTIHVEFRAVQTLRLVLDTLKQKRLAMSVKQFEEITAKLISFIRHKWMTHTQGLLNSLQSATGQISQETLTSLVVTSRLSLNYGRCLRVLSIYGIRDISTSDDVRQYMGAIMQAVKPMMKLTGGIPENNPLYKPMSKMLFVLVDSIVDAQQNHPIHFRVYLSEYLQFFASLICTPLDTKNDTLSTKLYVRSFLFIHRVISCPSYSEKSSGLSFSVGSNFRFDKTAAAQIQTILKATLTSTFIQQITNALVSRHLLLKSSDLELWHENAEQYIEECQMGRIDDCLCPAAESLLSSLIIHSSDIVCPILLDMLQHITKTTPPLTTSQVIPTSSPEYQNVLIKDAVYHAIGLAYPQLVDTLRLRNFDIAQWYTQVLSAELSSPSPTYDIIRRRVIWFLGKWVEAIPDHIRGHIYQQIATLLKHKDIVISYHAAEALGCYVQTVAFPNTIQTSYLPYAEHIFQALFTLIANTEELSTRQSLMLIMSRIIESLSTHLRPYVGMLVQHFPKLWDSFANANVLRATLIESLSSMVTTLGVDSVQLHPFLINVLEYALNPNHTDEMHLEEHALELWEQTIKMAPVMTQPLLHLFRHLLTGMSDASDTDRREKQLRIMESYGLLGGNEFMSRYATQIASAVKNMMETSNDHGQVLLCCVLETYAQLYPHQFPSLFSDTLSYFIRILMDAKAHSLLSKEEKQSSHFDVADLVMAHFCHVLGRLFYSAYEPMLHFITTLTQGSPFPCLASLIDIWSTLLDSMADVYKKKVSCLAMCHFFSITDTSMLHRVHIIVNVVSGVLAQLENDPEKSAVPNYAEIRDIPVMQRTEVERVKLMIADDPSNSIDLRSYMMDRLQKLSATIGPQAFQEVLKTVDPIVLQQIQQGPPRHLNVSPSPAGPRPATPASSPHSQVFLGAPHSASPSPSPTHGHPRSPASQQR